MLIKVVATVIYRASKICSPEVFQIELNIIKELLLKDRNPSYSIDNVFKQKKSRKSCKTLWARKIPSQTKGKKSTQIEINIKKMTEKYIMQLNQELFLYPVLF